MDIRQIAHMDPNQAKESLIATQKALLDKLSEREIMRRINRFRDLPFRTMSYEEIEDAIGKVLQIEGPHSGEPQWILPWRTGNYPAGYFFYRVRKGFICRISDCLAPPAEIVNLGRLNKANEPVLYTSPCNPTIALDEVGIPTGELASIIVYRSNEQVDLTWIGADDSDAFDPGDSESSESQTTKLSLFLDFLKHEFTRDVGGGTEYLYQISEIIANGILPVTPDRDGWIYPSVSRRGEFVNVCFLPDRASRKLQLVGVLLAEIIDRGNPDWTLRNLYFGYPQPGLALLDFELFDSEKHDRHFPTMKR